MQIARSHKDQGWVARTRASNKIARTNDKKIGPSIDLTKSVCDTVPRILSHRGSAHIVELVGVSECHHVSICANCIYVDSFCYCEKLMAESRSASTANYLLISGEPVDSAKAGKLIVDRRVVTCSFRFCSVNGFAM